MAHWTDPIGVLRDDDPYNAWAFLRAAERFGEENFTGSEGFCPVIIKLRVVEETIGGLQKAIETFAQSSVQNQIQLGPGDPAIEANPDGVDTEQAVGPFLLSPYDVRHLQESYHRLLLNGGDNQDAPLEEAADYARILLAFAKEEDLIRELNQIREVGAEGLEYEILFSGRPIQPLTLTTSERVALVSDNKPDVDLAIIDDSIGFLNKDFFYRADANAPWVSRFNEIWVQDLPTTPDGTTVNFGYQLTSDIISQHLATVSGLSEFDAYQKELTPKNARPIKPIDFTKGGHQPLGFSISHGTHVASTALRSYHQSLGGTTSLETFGDSLAMHAVTLPTPITQDTSGSSLPPYLIAALRQVMLWNDEYTIPDNPEAVDQIAPPPLVINLSYGFPAGPKDGSSPLSKAIAQMLQSRNALGRQTALVVPMGNGFEDKGVASATLKKNQKVTFDWVILPDDRTSSFLEVFAKGLDNAHPAKFSIKIKAPNPQIDELDTIADGGNPKLFQRLVGEDGTMAGWVDWPAESGSYWDRRGFLALAPTFLLDEDAAIAPHGRWEITITNETDAEIELLAMVQRDDAPGTYPEVGRQSFLDHPDVWNKAMSGPEKPEAGTEDRPIKGKKKIEHPTLKPGNAFGQLQAGGLVTHAYSASELAAIDSPYVFVAGAGMGLAGDAQDQPPLGPSPYASEGPLLVTGQAGPDFTGLADRNFAFPGVYAAGTYSSADQPMNGASVSCPELSGLLAAAALDLISGDKQDLATHLNGGTVPRPDETDNRFGQIRKR